MPISLDETFAYLVPLAGPVAEQYVLSSDQSPVTLGRHESCELPTPGDEERISRFHAQFHCNAGQWFVTDLKSTWGTYLNGYRLPADVPHALAEGDLLRMTPCTFSFRHAPVRAGAIPSWADLHENVTIVRSIFGPGVEAAARPDPLAGMDPLAMLVEAVAGLHQAADEVSLARVVIDAARRGTGYCNAAYLRPADADGAIEVIAALPDRQEGIYSRSLLSAAGSGHVAVLDGGMPNTSHSVVMLQIQSALCVPLVLGQAVAAYLYLDTRGKQGAPRIHPRASDFCLALGRVASLALANLKRIEIERRQARMTAELEQAAAIQRYLFPARTQQVGPVGIIGESRPGQFVGGDFFDVIPLAGGQLAVTLGDVSGKGVSASVLMTTIHGFLHATLASGTPVGEAVCRLNAFLWPRRPEERFATLFCAVIDVEARTLEFVDAGHGYAMLWGGRTLGRLLQEGGPPLGLFPEYVYESTTVPLPLGASLLVVSDGIVEQPSREATREQFGRRGIESALLQLPAGADPVEGIFRALETHASSHVLADDATILLVRWEPATTT